MQEDFDKLQEDTEKLFPKYSDIMLMPNHKIKNLAKRPNIDIVIDCKIPSYPTVFDPDNQREKKQKIQDKVNELKKNNESKTAGDSLAYMTNK